MLLETSKGGFSPVTGPDADHFFKCRDKDFAIANFPGPRPFSDGLQNSGNQLIRRQDRDLYFGQEVNRILGAAVNLGMTLLTAEAPYLGYGYSLHADTVEALLYFIQLVRSDDRINALHHEPFCVLDSGAIFLE